ncbi:Scr1 family TA system antitoxin-like transcriptional regulator [Streptomyces sp. NPDC015032]|uniref:helix-turn-helix domain-containing protein n=1 Tax=Streptomyces sp. NPDC015032 TaxID=3364937 RepID=UPI0036F698FD
MTRQQTCPTALVGGATLRDARERHMMLPEEPADLLGIGPDTVLAMESGSRAVSASAITALSRLYRCGADTRALQRLMAGAAEPETLRDGEPGHAPRLRACARQAASVRWLSTVRLPPPLQTRAYALAAEEHSTALRGAPLAPGGDTVYVLDSRVITCGSGTPSLMAEQLAHLMQLAGSGTVIRVVAEAHPIPQPPGHLVELTFPAGRVVAQPSEDGVTYHRSDGWSRTIDDAFKVTDPASSREALAQAAVLHRAGARTTTGPL